MVEEKETKKGSAPAKRPAAAPKKAAGPAVRRRKAAPAEPSETVAAAAAPPEPQPERSGPAAMGLHQLSPARGATRSRKRVGRGPGSGHGKTAGRGNKGQKSRSGYRHQRGFEGGQMPLHRRVPKRGFTNIFRIEYDIVNISHLDRFEAGAAVTPDTPAGLRLAPQPRPVQAR